MNRLRAKIFKDGNVALMSNCDIAINGEKPVEEFEVTGEKLGRVREALVSMDEKVRISRERQTEH